MDDPEGITVEEKSPKKGTEEAHKLTKKEQQE